MKWNKRWMVIAGTVLVAGAVATGGAFAAAKGEPKADQSDKHPQLTPGQTEVKKQLLDLRKSRMDQLRVDSQALIDQAVKGGKLTQEQADAMKRRVEHGHKAGDGHHKEGKHHLKNMTLDEVKAKLNEAVKSGKLTQEKADKMLENWTRRHSNKQ